MGIYNCAGTLSEAIDSILSQTYSDWELIMCDDGSIDSTYSIAAEYSNRYPSKIKVIQNPQNMGLNFTLNNCLKLARGEYIARMDGDDISLPTRFEKEVAFLDTHPEYAIVSTPMIYFDNTRDFGIGHSLREPSASSLAKSSPFCHAPCMVRHDAFNDVDGYSVSQRRIRVEDWDLWIRMYEKGYRGYNLPEPLYKMRDDLSAYSRRKFRYRINEAIVSASAVRKLKLSPLLYCWALRPIIVGLLPRSLYLYLHKRKAKL